MHKGRVVFGAMDEVIFGTPAAEAVVRQMDRLRTNRAFLMVSGTLNRTTEEIAKVRRALGNRFAGLFDRMPPHTPRHAVIEAAAMAREAKADLIVTVGGVLLRVSCPDSAMLKHAACAAAINSSGVVSSRPPSVRVLKPYGPSKSPVAKATRP